jgi:GT2 family glycosyltransferase
MGRDPETAMLAAEYRTVPTRLATFVSLLIDSRVVAQHGLPFSDYFIWNDDTEYTARILRNGFGVLVPRSHVVHKTGQKHGMMEAAPSRFYYQVRNVIWMASRSDAWVPLDRVKFLVKLAICIIRYLGVNRWSQAALVAIGRGVRDGIFTAPRA